MNGTLTARQQSILGFLNEYIREHGFAPTVREIARHFGMAGAKGAKKHLDALVRKGAIERLPRQPRAITIAGHSRLGRPLPILGTVRAGAPLLAEEHIEGHFRVDRDLDPSGEGFLLRVKGESMIEAHILEGDYVLIQRQSTVRSGEIAVVLVDGEATLKYFIKKKDQIILRPAHPEMKPIVVDRDQSIEILGRVTAVLRMLDAGNKRKKTIG